MQLSLLPFVGLDEDAIGDVHILPLVLYGGQDLQCLIDLHLLLLVDLVRLLIEDTVLEELYANEAVHGGQPLSLDDLEVLVHEFDVGLIGNNWAVDVGEGLGALRTASRLLGEQWQGLRVLALRPQEVFRLVIQRSVLDEVIDPLVDLLELLAVPEVGLLHGGTDGGAFIMRILKGLVLHFDGDVGLLEEGQGGVVDPVLAVTQVDQFEEVILQDLGSLFLHVDLLGVPVAKLAVVDVEFALGVPREGQYILAVGTGEAEGAPAVLEGGLVEALAGPALLGGELGDGAVVAAVGGAVDAGVDLLLQDVPVALALDLHLRLGLLRLLQEVDARLRQRVHLVIQLEIGNGSREVILEIG